MIRVMHIYAWKGKMVMATLNTAFKQVYEEDMKDNGFVKVKGRQPYFARMIGEEIVQVITVRNQWCGERGYKCFEILGGVATIYRKNLDLTKSPNANLNWLNILSSFYTDDTIEGYDDNYRVKLMKFEYEKDNDNSLFAALNESLQETKKIVIPIMDRISNLEDCIDYFDRFNAGMMNFGEYHEENGEYEENDEQEDLLFIQTDNHDDLKYKFDLKYLEAVKKIESRTRPESEDWKEKKRKRLEEWRLRRISKRDYIYNHPKVHQALLEELEERKTRNTEALRSCGLL